MKKYTKITITMFLLSVMSVGLVACGNKKEENETEVVMTETDAVTYNEDGELVDAVSGKELTESEIQKLTEEGVLKKTDDGKVEIDQDKNKKEVKVTVDKTGKVVADAKNTDQTKPTTEEKEKQQTTEKKAETGGNSGKATEAPKQEKTTEKATEAPKQEKTTEKATEAPKKESTTTAPKQEKTTEKATEAPKQEKTTEKATEKATEAAKTCNHNWVWKTHTETVHHSEQYLMAEAYDKPIYVQKIKCGGCGKIYNSIPEFDANDNCHVSYGNVAVLDHYEHHDAEYGTEEWDTYEEVNDYQYCSICGQRK